MVSAYAHPSKIPIRHDAPEPKPAEDQVIIDVYSAALNFFDVRMSTLGFADAAELRGSCCKPKENTSTSPLCRLYVPRLIRTRLFHESLTSDAYKVLGAELAGKIAADSPIPAGCPFKPGDRVFGEAQGAYADKVAANWRYLHALPPSITFEQGAGTWSRFYDAERPPSEITPGLQVAWSTSYEGLVGRAELKAGKCVTPSQFVRSVRLKNGCISQANGFSLQHPQVVWGLPLANWPKVIQTSSLKHTR